MAPEGSDCRSISDIRESWMSEAISSGVEFVLCSVCNNPYNVGLHLAHKVQVVIANVCHGDCAFGCLYTSRN